ncbi:25571_t:CDS:2, partial [Racocetra persica]
SQPDLNTILTALNQLQLDNQTLHQKNTELRDVLNQFRAQGVDNNYKEPKVSLPDKFDGTRSGPPWKLVNWISFSLVHTFVGKAIKASRRLGELVKEFEATFGDADKSRTAANKIRKLVQGSRPASNYASEFRQIASDLDWGEAALVDQFRTGLRDDIKDLLLTIEDPTLLNDAISKAHPRDSGSGRHQISAPSNSASSVTEPMQIDAVRYKPLSVGEKERRPPAVVRGLRLDQDISLNPKILLSYSSNTLTPKLSLHLPGGSEVKIVALVDSGASACFLDTTFAQECNIPIYKKELPFSVEVIDGRKISSGNVTHEPGPLLICLQDHYEKMLFNLISSPYYPIILGLPWLDLHNPTINWHERSIIFSDPMCKEHHTSS